MTRHSRCRLPTSRVIALLKLNQSLNQNSWCNDVAIIVECRAMGWDTSPQPRLVCDSQRLIINSIRLRVRCGYARSLVHKKKASVSISAPEPKSKLEDVFPPGVAPCLNVESARSDTGLALCPLGSSPGRQMQPGVPVPHSHHEPAIV